MGQSKAYFMAATDKIPFMLAAMLVHLLATVIFPPSCELPTLTNVGSHDQPGRDGH